jgi:hypothetical protein
LEARRAFLTLEQFRKFFNTAILILASKQISSDGVGNMKAESILVPESLAETLWRLEEARLGFRPKSVIQVEEALEWVVSRQGLEGSYMNLFAGTEKDMLGVELPTGERIESAALRHILGEEALRVTILWNLESSNNVRKAINGFNQLLVRGENSARNSGFYCCYKCTPAFLRTLGVVKPGDWKKTLEKGIQKIKLERTNDGRWHGFPFFYTLLTLSEMDLPSAKAELRYASKLAQKLLGRYQKQDRTSRFRMLGLKAAISA